MDRALELKLEKTYDEIKRKCPKTMIDSFEAVKEVEAYRQFWKPKQTNIVLLAESHVYTDQSDFSRNLNNGYMQRLLPGYPSHFVRFVYCLGYGEDTLLDGISEERLNSGTPQFWKIFSYCAAENPDNPQDYKILKTGTPSFNERIKNKIALLHRLQERGIWLLDASMVGLYGNDAKSDMTACRNVIESCWDYIDGQIEAAKPKYIIVVGKGVSEIIESQLKVPHETIDLPSAHKPASELLKDFRRYCEVCDAVLENKPVHSRNTQAALKENGMPAKMETSAVYGVEPRLTLLGYLGYANAWRKGDRAIQIIKSKEFGYRIRVNWKDSWQDHYALIFDYSQCDGPVCIVPTKALFEAKFVREKKATQAYANCGHQWSQPFPKDHELSKLILNYTDRWDLL
jgi:hypothetical protein